MANILVCDDSSLIRLKLKNILDNEDHDVLEAKNFKEIKLNNFSNDITLDKIDAIFLAVSFENISGIKVLEYLVKNHSDIPVLMISVDNNRKKILRALKIGAVDYILKPFDKVFIIDKLNSILATNDFSEMQKMEHIEPEKPLPSLKEKISMEVNRSLRSKLSFSVVKFTAKDQEKINGLKKFTPDIVRDIDSTFTISKDILVLLLPLTNKKGFQKLKNRLENSLENSDSIENIAEINIITFPDNINEELKYKKTNKYRKKILKQLNLC